MTRARGILSAFVLICALVLSACAGLPASGPVNPGLAAGEDAGSPEFLFRPDEPQPDATPEQIVEGFIRAGSGPGPAANWEVARMFLAPSIRETWNPEASVTIDLPDDRLLVSPTEGAVELSVVAVATVDSSGAYQPDAGVTPLAFRLAQQDDGEWRITEAPDGVVIDRDVFTNVFHRYSLQYFDPTWQFLVPDVRWFPTTNAATRIARALVNGTPSLWLAGSVQSAFPESVSLARPVGAAGCRCRAGDPERRGAAGGIDHARPHADPAGREPGHGQRVGRPDAGGLDAARRRTGRRRDRRASPAPRSC